MYVETCAHEQCCCLNGQKHQKENFGQENFVKPSHDVQTVQIELKSFLRRIMSIGSPLHIRSF